MLVKEDDLSSIATGPRRSIRTSANLGNAPIIASVQLRENDATADRFTSQDFTATVEMAQQGNPDVKSIRGWVEGNLTASKDGVVATNPILNLDASLNGSIALLMMPESPFIEVWHRADIPNQV